MVLYLLSKQNANPLIRNNWGEAAYDAAAAVFEVWICEVDIPFVPMVLHFSVPLDLTTSRSRTLAWN